MSDAYEVRWTGRVYLVVETDTGRHKASFSAGPSQVSRNEALDRAERYAARLNGRPL